MTAPLVALGKAYELAFRRDGRSTVEVAKFPGWWWAWSGSPSAGNILLVKPKSRSMPFPIPRGASRAMHATFHGSPPDFGMEVDVPEIAGAKRAGLVVSFAYDARTLVGTKSDKPYRHHFGAETHDDKPPFMDADLPVLAVTTDGGLIIKRRSGNGFRLSDWVIG